MKLSCGIVLINSMGRILACKPHERPHQYYDVPKGEIDEGETPYECALRETFEETGLDLTDQELIDCGEFTYIPNKKNIHLFMCHYDIDNIENLVCTSMYFNRDKKMLCPEISEYRFVTPEQIEEIFYPSLVPVLKNIL